jgi:V8-like Glu-specific endopeptidase
LEETQMARSKSSGRRLAAAAFTAVAAAAFVVPAFASSAFAAPSTGAAGAAGDNAHAAAGVTAEAMSAGRAKHGANVTAAQAIADYWTPARMKAAQPAEDSPQFQAAAALHADQVDQQSQTGDRSAGRPAAEHQVNPTGSVGGPALAAFDPNLSSSSPTARTAGKVFFTLSGVDKVCSGTVINSEGKDTVWTAGHCVHGGKGGTWAANWSFAPAYDDDLTPRTPYGIWTANRLWTKTGWANDSTFSDDMGVAIMNTNDGSHIVSRLGGQGIKVNAGKSVFDYAFGYPAEMSFDGGNLYRCSGTISSESSQTVKMSCDMTRGSSGGGWLNAYDGNWGYLNGVNSRIDSITSPTIMASPYFDDSAWDLYNSTRNL